MDKQYLWNFCDLEWAIARPCDVFEVSRITLKCLVAKSRFAGKRSPDGCGANIDILPLILSSEEGVGAEGPAARMMVTVYHVKHHDIRVSVRDLLCQCLNQDGHVVVISIRYQNIVSGYLADCLLAQGVAVVIESDWGIKV